MGVGVGVGECAGVGVGVGVGECVGLAVGLLVGVAVGDVVGELVGDVDGCVVGGTFKAFPPAPLHAATEKPMPTTAENAQAIRSMRAFLGVMKGKRVLLFKRAEVTLEDALRAHDASMRRITTFPGPERTAQNPRTCRRDRGDSSPPLYLKLCLCR